MTRWENKKKKTPNRWFILIKIFARATDLRTVPLSAMWMCAGDTISFVFKCVSMHGTHT